MTNFNALFKKLSVVFRVFLCFTLILGILSSAFGITVVAMKQKNASPENETVVTPDSEDKTEAEETFEAPTEGYDYLNNEVELDDDVVVLTDEESQLINDSIMSVEQQEYYNGDFLRIELFGEDYDYLDALSRNDIIYLQGDQSTPFGEDRILKIRNVYTDDGNTYLETTEPYFEDVFESMEICSSIPLSKENFIDAYYAEGVTSHFGDVSQEMSGVSQTESLGDSKIQSLAAVTKPEIAPMGSPSQFNSYGDLIIEIDLDTSKEEEDDALVKSSYGIKGQFGVKDLTAYMVCDMPKVTEFKELFFGISGSTFVNVDVYGNIEASVQPEASKKDMLFFSLEGLNEKLIPIAIFKFKGTTPVYITDKAFDKQKKSVIPSLYLMVYSDWEGNISLELRGGFDYKNSFNNGIRIFKEGKPCLSFENYPYTKSYDVEAEDGLIWDVTLQLEADTDLTILGASGLFYVAGVNLCELSVARLGVQAKCDVSISADSKDGLKVLDKDDTEAFVRGYLKFIECKVKLKADGKTFLKNLSIDVNFEFALLDLTLFSLGDLPNKYKPKMPISSMKAPTEFESVITLVFDVSGSMDSRIDTGETKLTAAKSASKVIVNTTENYAKGHKGNYGIGIVMFSNSATTVSVPHIDYKYLEACIDTLGDGGGTNISSGIDSGIEQLESVECKNKVIILLTDGQDSGDAETRESAKNAADKDIKIYTIGFGSDVDESILREVAELTGGEYRFANTENMVSIMGGFMYAQQSTNSDVISEIEGSVAEGETTDAQTFTVKDQSGDLTVTTAWPGSFLDTILIDPNGREVDENYNNAVIDETQIPSTITVKDPIKGKWKVRIKGVETSYEKEPFYTIVAFEPAETEPINERMSKIELAASYCIPIGIFVTISSIMFLIAFRKKEKSVAEK